jgi:hypothetical protein
MNHFASYLGLLVFVWNYQTEKILDFRNPSNPKTLLRSFPSGRQSMRNPSRDPVSMRRILASNIDQRMDYSYHTFHAFA